MSEPTLAPPAAKLAYSVAEVAALTPFSKRTIHYEISAGRLKARKRGASTFILAADLEEYLKGSPATGENVQ